MFYGLVCEILVTFQPFLALQMGQLAAINLKAWYNRPFLVKIAKFLAREKTAK